MQNTCLHSPIWLITYVVLRLVSYILYDSLLSIFSFGTACLAIDTTSPSWLTYITILHHFTNNSKFVLQDSVNKTHDKHPLKESCEGYEQSSMASRLMLGHTIQLFHHARVLNW